MNFKSIKLQILFVASMLLCTSVVWPQAVEELPEDRTPALGGVNPYAESDECEARAAAITAVPPKFPRPKEDRYQLEEKIRMYEPIAGTMEFDQGKFNALEKAVEKRYFDKNNRHYALKLKLEKLEGALAEAKNQQTNQSLIAELQAKVSATKNELEDILLERDPESEPLLRMRAARQVLEAKRGLTLLVLWQEYELISEQAVAAEEAKDKELDSVKAAYEAEKARFTQQLQALKQQSDRSEATLQKGRDLRLLSANNFAGLKNRLQKFICWPEVQGFDKQLEEVIRKLRTSKTSLPVHVDFQMEGIAEEIPEDQDPFGDDEQKPPTTEPTTEPATGSQWVLESVTQSPVNPPQGWSYSSGSASLQIYNGDKCSFSWTPPPQQIDSGFTVSLTVQCTAGTPRARIAGSIAVSGSGISSDPSGQVEAYASGDGSASASKSVSFKPVAGSSSIEINVSIQWAVGFKYKYRKAN